MPVLTDVIMLDLI